MSDQSNTSGSTAADEKAQGDSTAASNDSSFLRKKIVLGIALLFLACFSFFMVFQYVTAQAVVSISNTKNLDPITDYVVITYRKPVEKSLFGTLTTVLLDGDQRIEGATYSKLDKTKTVETLYFNRRAPFNRALVVVREKATLDRSIAFLLGLKPIPIEIPLSTDVERIQIDDLLPTASRVHAPEALNNQIAIVFTRPVGQTYKKRVKLRANELPFIALEPLPSGYFQWSDDKTLTFNFTAQQPRFDTEYQFQITPEDLIDDEYQVWEGKTAIALKTSSNDVYVNDVSIDESVGWNTPITFEFSGNMVDIFELNKDKATSVMPVSMSPLVDGVWRWVNAKTVSFTPSEAGWPVRQQVAIEFLPDVNSELDRNWTDNRQLNRIEFFVKPRLQWIDNISLRGEKVDPEAVLEVKFSRDMIENRTPTEQSTLDSASAPIVMTPVIEGHYFWKTSRVLVIEPAEPWSELTQYQVSVHPDFNPDTKFEWFGTQDFTFTTAENVISPAFYRIPEIKPTGAKFFSNQSKYLVKSTMSAEDALWFEFNRPFGKTLKDTETLTQGIEMTPPIEGDFEWLSDTLLSFTPAKGWVQQTQYQITLNEKLLYFHEQHYEEGRSQMSFDIVDDSITASINPSYLPEDEVTVTFEKNVESLVKVGRRYTKSEVTADVLPLDLPFDYEFEWVTSRELKLYPTPYWPASIEQPFMFNKHLLPRAQSHWHESNNSVFKTSENRVSVASVSPSGVSSRYTEIEVEFSKRIKPQSSPLGTVERSRLVTIEPGVSGEWRWKSESKLVFKPDEPLAPSTDYELVVDPEFIESDQFSWSTRNLDDQPIPSIHFFHSPYQRVKSATAGFEFDEENPLKQRFFIDIELSEWTTFSDVEKRFTLWVENYVDDKYVETPLIHQITTEDDKNKLRHFRVVSDFIDRPNKDRRVYYQLDQGVPALGGNVTMEASFFDDFLQEKPRFIAQPGVGWSFHDGKLVANMRLDAPVEVEKLKQHLSITSRDGSLPYQVSITSNSRYSSAFTYLVEAAFVPAQLYTFELTQGLLAADGALTNESVVAKSVSPELKRRVEFAAKGNILSKHDTQKIPVLTSNVPEFRLAIDQIFPSNVRNYLNQGLSNTRHLGTAGKSVFDKIYSTEDIHQRDNKNKELTTHIDLADFFERNKKGLYRLHLSGAASSEYRWFLSSDIALIARESDDAIYVWAVSLATAKPLPGVNIELVDAWNQTAAAKRTNVNGFAKIESTNPENVHILLATKGDDFSFLDLRTQKERFAGFDVTGVQSVNDASLLQAYLYTERGVYRPGDTLHLVGVVRDQVGALPEASVVTLVLKDPTGAERFTERFATDTRGVVSLDHLLAADAKTGKWTAVISSFNEVIGSMNFQVEEFIPNKIKVALSAESTAAVPGQQFSFDVQANNLFGPPASARKVSGSVSLRPAYFKPKGYGDYEFGHDDHSFQQINADLIETRLDEKGHYRYEYRVPEGIDSPIGLDLHYNATVIDDSGRGVAEYAKVPVHLFDQYIGVKRTAKNTIELSDSVVFDTVNVRANGDLVPVAEQAFEYKVFRKRKVTHYRKNERGYYRYVTEKIDVELKTEKSSANQFEYVAQHSGEHYLQVTDLNGGQVSRYYFQVMGDRNAVSVVEAPESVILKARSSIGLVGEGLVVDVQAPFAGQLFLIAERDDVMWSKSITMTSTSTTVTLPITKEHIPNVYLSAVVVQPASEGSRAQPVYATGLLNITVRDQKHTPELTISAPEKVSPNSPMSINVSIAGANNGEVFFTLAAVDEGILDLTKFKTPNMRSAFLKKQRLDVKHYSVYPWVMPYEDDVLRSISPSGSAPARALIKKKRENPDAAARVKSVALWSGLQTFGADGKATVTLDVPEFDGSLRLMLVAFGDQRYNAKETTVTVRDDLVLKPALPRFMATGDHFELPFNLFNSTNITGDVMVTVEHSDHIQLLGNTRDSVALNAGGEGSGAFSFIVNDTLGLADVTLTAEGLGEKTVKHIQVPVRSAGNYVSLSDSGVVDAVSPKTIQIPQVFKPSTEIQMLAIEPAGMLGFTGSLKYLLDYPHGCLEQTTSKLFPLLFFEDFAKGANFSAFNTSTPRYYLREGIDKLERMQLENGYFSYWSGGESVNHYAFLYAAHFLAEARLKGLEINEAVWNNLQYRLNEDALNLYANSGNQQFGLSHQVYALYVLALSGNSKIGEMNYLLENRESELEPHDKARLAAAFKLSGRNDPANELLADLTSFSGYDNPYRQTAGTFSSNIRDLAVLLDAVLEVDPKSDVVPLLIEQLSSSRKFGRWYSTQENAIAMMAMGKSIARNARTQRGDFFVTMPNGEEVKNTSVTLSTVDLLSGEVAIRATDDAEVNYFWQADGISLEANVEDEDSGLKVRRKFFNTQRELVDLNNVRQGDLVVVELKMMSLDDTIHNIAVVDLLPMGLEIENARLSTSSDIPWLRSSAKVDHADIRDDRMNLYLTLSEQEVVYYYTTRAVTVGNFAIPSVRAEAMYDESKYSLSGAGELKVLPMK